MNAAASASKSGWGLFSETLTHGAASVAIEMAFEVLLGLHEEEIERLKAVAADVKQIKESAYHRAQVSAATAGEIESKQGTPEFDQSRFEFHVNEALRHYLDAASQPNGIQQSKSYLAASYCAHRLGFQIEANKYRDLAESGLRKTNQDIYRVYNQRKNRIKRFLHGNVRVSMRDASAVGGGLVLLTILTAGADIPVLAIWAAISGAVGVAAGASKLLADRDLLGETLDAIKIFGQETFGGEPWHGSEDHKTYRLKVKVEYS